MLHKSRLHSVSPPNTESFWFQWSCNRVLWSFNTAFVFIGYKDRTSNQSPGQMVTRHWMCRARGQWHHRIAGGAQCSRSNDRWKCGVSCAVLFLHFRVTITMLRTLKCQTYFVDVLYVNIRVVSQNLWVPQNTIWGSEINSGINTQLFNYRQKL
jgi:hypothetical protein